MWYISTYRNAVEILDDNTTKESGIDLNCSHDNYTPMSKDFILLM